MNVLDVLDIPLSPVGLTWVGSIGAASLSIHFNVLSPSKFTFTAVRLKQEPWRLLLTFCYLGPPLLALLQYCYFMVKTVGMLEEVYTFSYGLLPHRWTHDLDDALHSKAIEIINRNRTRDFTYFVIQLGATIALTIWLLSFWGVDTKIYFLGPPLQRVLLYIRCRLYPEQEIGIMGLGIKAKYAFIASQLLEFLISDDYLIILNMFSRNPQLALHQLFTSQLLYEVALEFCVGHFWWYLRYFYLEVMYNETRDEWSKSLLRSYDPKLDFQEILRFMLTPIWYFLITKQLKAEQTALAFAQPVYEGVHAVDDIDNSQEVTDL